ncbi:MULTISPECIES: DUF3784 domain-containing protein [Sphingobacterium]|uniref:DUF3784 domain-containing protein n=1 Tax=Sphingobacterium TaxID=28453 RepID=UPI0013E51538|nr:DUF3784 domain-containing protein [Sphingobacterium sp. DR205]
MYGYSSLSGYNSLSPEEKQLFDIKAFIPYFKIFHLSLAGSYLLIFCFLLFTISPHWAQIFSVTYPFLAYIYFIWKTNRFFKRRNRKQYNLSLIVICLLFILLLAIVFQFLRN